MRKKPTPVKYGVIRVTSTQDYCFPLVGDGPVTQLDGRTLSEVETEFFRNYPLGTSHAARDSHKLGSPRLIKVEQVEDEGDIVAFR